MRSSSKRIRLTQDFARMGIHTQFDARNPVHMRALSEAASGPTNNNVLASASYEL